MKNKARMMAERHRNMELRDWARTSSGAYTPCQPFQSDDSFLFPKMGWQSPRNSAVDVLLLLPPETSTLQKFPRVRTNRSTEIQEVGTNVRRKYTKNLHFMGHTDLFLSGIADLMHSSIGMDESHAERTGSVSSRRWNRWLPDSGGGRNSNVDMSISKDSRIDTPKEKSRACLVALRMWRDSVISAMMLSSVWRGMVLWQERVFICMAKFMAVTPVPGLRSDPLHSP